VRPTEVLETFNDELRTTLLNVLYNRSKERCYYWVHAVVNAIAVLLVVMGLLLCGAHHGLGIAIGGAGAFLQFIRLLSDLSDRRSHYTEMRGKFNLMFVEAREAHKRFLDRRVSTKKLLAHRDKLASERKRVALHDDTPSAKRVAKLLRLVNEMLPPRLLWPEGFCPEEE
jgi:hypothetical protein